MHQPPLVTYVNVFDSDNANTITSDTIDINLQGRNRTSIRIRRPVTLFNQHCSKINVQYGPHAFRAINVFHQSNIRQLGTD